MASETMTEKVSDSERSQSSQRPSDTSDTSGRAARRDLGMPRRLMIVFAVACGLVAANLYYAQPMLETIAREFHATSSSVGQIVTVTQLGFAAGLLLLVPLGDLLDRRRLIAMTLLLATLGLIVMAVAPTLSVLLLAGLLVGVTSVVAQILVPFAATLANNANRGRVVGFVMSGLLLGILLSRTIAGLVSQVAGWRAVYGAAAALTLALIVILWRELPDAPRGATGISYGKLLRSVLSIAREEPLLRRRAAYGALAFAAFSVLWTSIAFLLARPPYGYNQAVIGLFGLVGVAGALAAAFAGRWADRGLARATTGGFILVALLAWGLIALGGANIIALIVGILLLDLGAQGIHITNQSEIYRLRPEARSRLTAAYMTTYFVGGALGSSGSALIYERAGWPGVAALGAAFIALALLLWFTELRKRQPPSPSRAASLAS
ncbi:MAG TPA: MFS transporter [Ktedonobacterales bacterium]|nr:MFS transporter [Ktedonobacterales bacterium]